MSAKPIPPEIRFWAKVSKGPGKDDCWLWTAWTFKDGYGGFDVDGRTIIAHRYAYILAYGTIPPDLSVCHNCPNGDNPGCVRPSHLWLGTTGANNRDAMAKGRLSSGDRHYARLRPERLARGDAHYSRRQPARLARGEENGLAKLTEAEAIEVLRAWSLIPRPLQTELAKRYGVGKTTINKLVRGITWKHLL